MPALGISMLLIAAGAILRFGITTTVDGLAIDAIGVILMIVGALGILMALLFMMSFSPWGRDSSGHDHIVR